MNFANRKPLMYHELFLIVHGVSTLLSNVNLFDVNVLYYYANMWRGGLDGERIVVAFTSTYACTNRVNKC
jgi:hypothetical protein